jgi:predicted ATP-dependent endonuclease of OLD family
LYDEPDLNLHYEAQKRLFENVSALAEDEDAKSQCFVCTHSVFFIDRAPAESINLIEIDDQNRRSATYIEGAGDGPETETAIDFFDQIGRAVGLSNTSLLYEKGFLVVEGESEDEALPILYNQLFSVPPSRDGLQIVNLRTCGAWKSVLGVLLKNRLEMVHLLLDSDCTSSETSLNLTQESLEEDSQIECPGGLFDNQTTFIGTREFEDSFIDDVYVRALNADFPRASGEEWQSSHVEDLRDEEKFSTELESKVFDEVSPQLRNDVRKPQIARSVAKHCRDDEIPQVLVEAFNSLRERAGID